MSDLAYTCPSKFGPYECGPVDYYVSAGFQVLLGLLLLAGVLFWLAAHVVGRWRDRPAARRERALAELDRRAAERDRPPRPEVPEPFRRPRGPQPW